MWACRTGLLGGVFFAVALSTGFVVHADVPAPDVGAACTAELEGAMTLLPDRTTYLRCLQQPGANFAWTAVQMPFPPNDTWFTYGPTITLHGQGMRNPNLSSGAWTGRPQDSEASCRVTQTNVLEAGVLAAPEDVAGEPGKPLAVQMRPTLFYAELAGDCLWVKD